MTTLKSVPSKAKKILLACTWVVALGCQLITPAQAQQVYRIVGADGKVTFSDKPPQGQDTQAKVNSASSGFGAVNVANTTLPFELRQIASKYPVTLYTGDNCTPCASARTLLTTRGVPFSEKTVKTADDIQALQRLSGENTLPFATIGSQQLKGFSDAEWTQFLNAAGYPAVSALLPSYRQLPAVPLVAATSAPTSPNTANSAPNNNPALPRAVEPGVNNPAGIKF